jgi:N-acetylglutamate synthase-like GNAT family acetyltransferase
MTVTVRKAEYADLGCYTELATQFIAASPLSSVVSVTPDSVANFLISAVDNPMVGIWLAEKDGVMVGICGAIKYPLYFSPQHTIVQELWWWLTPEARGSGAGQSMYKTLEAWAQENDAAALFMIALDDDRVEKTSKFYARAGFKPMERTFVKGADTWR